MLSGWGLTLAFSVMELIGMSAPLSPFLTVILVQSLALLEILHVLLGLVKSSIFFTNIQVLGRLLYACFLFSICRDLFPEDWIYLTCILAWSMADTVRSLYYLTKNKVTGFLRYNLFLILYPIGQLIEFLCCWIIIFKGNHPIRFLLIPLALSYFVLGKNIFVHMLDRRARYLISRR
ncbi:MAG: hypothetical protein HN509_02920 [Halobacteriovoraceae bacterium]|nr:hypothetical protein [Halobacteriovoraceae bacterium]